MEQVRAAYLEQARQCHPDRHGGSDEAKERFQAIAHAYTVLGRCWSVRRVYDLAYLDKLAVEVRCRQAPTHLRMWPK